MLIREFDERTGWLKWGFENCTQWLHWRCELSGCASREKVRVANMLRDLLVEQHPLGRQVVKKEDENRTSDRRERSHSTLPTDLVEI